MAETPRDLDAPPSGPAWNGTALAAGAGVLAGLLLGHKGAAGLAAGVAAAAGVKLLSSTRWDEQSAPAPLPHPAPDILPAARPVQKEPGDWVDHDSVLFGHLVPDATVAVQMLKEKALPLLDDDGLPVEHVSVRPAYPEDLKDDFPTGPIIWELGRFVQSRSDGSGETVWFSLQDVLRDVSGTMGTPTNQLDVAATDLPIHSEVEAPYPDTSGILEELPAEAPSVFPAEDLWSAPAPAFAGPEPLPEEADPEALPVVPDAVASPSATWEAASYLLSTPVAPPLEGPDEAGHVDAPFQSPFSPVAAAPGSVTVISPRPFLSAPLPQPRHADESPRHTAGTEVPRPGVLTGGHSVLTTDLIPAPGTSRAGVHTRPPRHLEPLAPVVSRRRSGLWSLVLMFCLAIIAGLFLAARWWNDGELLRRFEDASWRKPSGNVEKPSPLPAKVPMSSQAAPLRQGPWMSAAQEEAR